MQSTPSHTNPAIRIVTSTSLFDGHDAAINIMRRILQSSGAEVIHLGHNRSAQEIVNCAIQEDAQAIAITSYQGGHIEFFKYIYDLLVQNKSTHIKIFGGGGGTILPKEIEDLHKYGITKIYSPDDGRSMGLQGMIDELLSKCSFDIYDASNNDLNVLRKKNSKNIARMISYLENNMNGSEALRTDIQGKILDKKIPVLGVTGTGGAGKSSLVDELVRRYLMDFDSKTIAIISVDPSKKKSGGALLGDRIRMNSIDNSRVYMRSLATRQSNFALSKSVQDAIDVCKVAQFDLIIVETSGIGQSNTEIIDHCDVSLYVMTSEYGAGTQLEKIDMLDFADLVAINKFDKKSSLDALRDVKKQYKRNRQMWESDDDDLPVFGTIASQFNDPGVNRLYKKITETLHLKTGVEFKSQLKISVSTSEKIYIIPPDRSRYLSEIVEENNKYKKYTEEQCDIARKLYQVKGAIKQLENEKEISTLDLSRLLNKLETQLDPLCKNMLENWPAVIKKYKSETYKYIVRDKEFEQPIFFKSISHINIPKISLPRYKDFGDILLWLLSENVPGEFPFTSGVFPLKRQGEDPTRMFAGEGGPERTNRRFHYVSYDQAAKRLSTAFDSVTLYGEDPDHRPDIYGKIGNSGVNIATVDDAKKLYSGFNLCDPSTSVSMTINGPAPVILAFYMNAVIDQQCELYIRTHGLKNEIDEKIKNFYKNLPQPVYQGPVPEGNDGLGLMLLGISGDQVLPKETYQQIKAEALSKVRGTVQADILKEDQAQNTCIFSTEFALKMMGDIQQYFNEKEIKNFYSVSISGYHIAEAGANPITQLAFTLANGFTYVEYYLSRGMHIDDFAPNLSFFFSNGLDAEYSVLGRVARRIWAIAIKNKYGGNQRSQKLKYHIQTSGRSLHAQEISFNDIRTTLQALCAIYDNCNSLHTNAYDEAITTPTEDSVRRAMAIQLIINQELGLSKNENPTQGSFIIEELTDLVEEAVMKEFQNISERGGVLGAMENMYQRSKIQEESLYYETLKHNGKLPIVGVNTFLDPKGSPTIIPKEIIRSENEEKEFAIASLNKFKEKHKTASSSALKKLQYDAVNNANIFESLMEAAKTCSLGQITHALYEVGGQYRRNM
jgi:methylmalonyl-CoA mutase